MKNETISGVGIGLRDEHINQVIETKPAVGWFELLVDNYLADNADLERIDQVVSDYPISFHGVGLSIGSDLPVDFTYLEKIRSLKERWNPVLYSDHLSWSSTKDYHFHELLPVPSTHESVEHIADKISQVQDFMGEQILMENPSTYVKAPSEMPEWEFVNAICSRSGCGLLLDINNIQVNAFNHGFTALEFIRGINKRAVKEIHLAGYEDCGDYYFDSHGQPVSIDVWELYVEFIKLAGERCTLIEWDNNLPDFSELLLEAKKAESLSCINDSRLRDYK